MLASRLEVVDSTLRGSDGFDPYFVDGGPGGDGVVCQSAARVHLVRSIVRGGDGGDGEGSTGWGGDGGDGLLVRSSSHAILAGDGTSWIRGGDGGIAYRQWGEDGWGDGLYAFEHDGSSWVQTDFIPNPYMSSTFGTALDLRGDLLAVGVPGGTDSGGFPRGLRDGLPSSIGDAVPDERER
jgi:hypothetical protein